ncbi:hypothetical protein MA03_07160 [Infirmifilum uzonense]|uniref:Helicase HerA central domain-containing protein n=1 Tax=Infirmifilum uzonense TaxID=1550241 RepID=A0A0F7FI52_9CREN|nr:DUF87 domain-containing protein [Infirmifilum uzonense]AKG39058.1 hypothetical protein MA03_07160 [Infirmifilum uzonense]
MKLFSLRVWGTRVKKAFSDRRQSPRAAAPHPQGALWGRAKVTDLLMRSPSHIALIGRTGSGKTTAAKWLVTAAITFGVKVHILDFDNEYSDLPLPRFTPPFIITSSAPLPWLLAQMERPGEGGHGIALAVASASAASLEAVERELRAMYNDRTATAAAARLRVLKKYIVLNNDEPPAPGIWDLSMIPDPEERAMLSQFLASYIVAASPGTHPSLLVIEEAGMGATQYFLRSLLYLSRRRGVRIIYISHALPPTELIADFDLLLFDAGSIAYKLLSELRLPIPAPAGLRPGEAWWVRGTKARKIQFPPWVKI